jgi:hypothetical protein
VKRLAGIDLMIIAEDESKVLADLASYGLGDCVHYRVEAVLCRLRSINRSGFSQQRILDSTRGGKALSDAHQQRFEEDHGVRIRAVEHNPATGHGRSPGKISQQRRFTIASGSLEQHQFVGKALLGAARDEPTMASLSHCSSAGRGNIRGGKPGHLIFLMVWTSRTDPSPNRQKKKAFGIVHRAAQRAKNHQLHNTIIPTVSVRKSPGHLHHPPEAVYHKEDFPRGKAWPSS